MVPGKRTTSLRVALCALLFLLLQIAAHAVPPCCAAAPARNVLLISSYHPGFPTFFRQVEGLNSVLKPAGVKLDVEFMDSKRFNIPENLTLFYELLKFKLGKLPPYDVIVTSDDNALSFALKHRDTLFPDTPIVFCGVNNESLAHSMVTDPMVTGVIESVSMQETIDLIWKLRPDAKTMYAIVDETPSGQGDLATYRSLQSHYPGRNLAVLNLTDMTWDELGQELESIPESSGLLLLSAYRDKNGASKTFEEGLAWILDHAKAPLFHLWSHGLGQGIIGGKIISQFEQGRIAGHMALRLINGEPPRSIPIIEGDQANRFAFDQLVLNKYHISDALVPPDSQILNKPPGIWSTHRIEVVAALIVFMLLAVFFVILSLYANKLRKTKVMLSEAHKRLSFHVTNSPLALIEWEDGRHIKKWSKQAEEMFGWTEEEVIGKNWNDFEFIYEDDIEDVTNELLNLFEGRSTFNTVENRNYRKDKSIIYCQWYNSSLMDEDGAMISLLSQVADVTKLKTYEANLLQAKEQAEASNRAKSEFLANMSHEIRTPMNGVVGMLQLLRSSKLNPEQSNSVDMALQASERLTLLLSDILDISVIEAGYLKVNKSPLDISGVLKQTVELFKPAFSQKGIVFSASIDPDVRTRVLGDATRVQQVLANFIGNAFKFTASGSVAVSISSQPVHPPGHVRLLFTVADTGIGISDNSLEILFNPFTQGSQGHQRNHEGAGLGLSICKRLVELMGGSICVDSELGVGTTIYCTIPFELDQRTGAVRDDRLAEEEPGPEKIKVLVAEDDAISRTAARKQLEHMGYEVCVVENGQRLLEVLREEIPDVILMDVRMPLMDGLEATRAIRRGEAGADKAGIPIIAMTAYAMNGDRDLILAAGMDEYISKPVDLSVLKAVLESVLKQSKADHG
ncbi:ABC transporter substrate binding protein [Oceanidesulfovibrio marinus]|uniref:histidine kinase n=1 Tax=Oceanidesulfovibrio marinus TaxID=370038 RepID=A0ABX6NA29_9BACT|nr:ABC transporter substrate binding protein [Oceanidesulfovibrio marinus]QJT07447.1 response regulator [Oceanidesulfovibrio marinus]